MSLVSEALRKARARAADGAAGTPTVPPTLVLPPRRYRPGFGAVALVLVALAAAVGGAAGVWWALGRQRSQPFAAAPAATAAPLASAPAPGGGAPAGAPPGSATAAAGDAGTPGGAPPHGTAPAAGDGSTDTAAMPDAAAAADPAAGTVRPQEPGPAAAGGEGTGHGERRTRDALIDADLGYAKLHLDYLVYRPGSPFGRVNGQDVIVGSTVAGFRVDEITADHIKLSDHRHVVVLRVR